MSNLRKWSLSGDLARRDRIGSTGGRERTTALRRALGRRRASTEQSFGRGGEVTGISLQDGIKETLGRGVAWCPQPVVGHGQEKEVDAVGLPDAGGQAPFQYGDRLGEPARAVEGGAISIQIHRLVGRQRYGAAGVLGCLITVAPQPRRRRKQPGHADVGLGEVGDWPAAR